VSFVILKKVLATFTIAICPFDKDDSLYASKFESSFVAAKIEKDFHSSKKMAFF
jgi:hypothetical protein